MNHPAIIQVNHGASVTVTTHGNAFSKLTPAVKSMEIDARSNRVYIIMTEERLVSNRRTSISIQLSRQEWDKLKELIARTGGEL